MPIIRNPFRRNEEATRVNSSTEKSNGATIAPPKHIDIKEPTEYKLSEINGSGVYLPPSPTERKNFWSTKSNTSSNSSSSNHRSMLAEEPFNISRESFDSYRRSFDISARSPVLNGIEGRPRVSLDSRLHSNPPRHSTSFNRPLPPSEEDTFEDVGLNDEPKPKKQGFLSRFTHSDVEPKVPSSHSFHISGRKRGQSGGQELGSMPKPNESTEKVVKGGED